MSDVTERQSSEVSSRDSRELERSRQTALRPPADIFEDAEGITLLMDMPGVTKERLNVETNHNTLLVEGEVEIDVPDGMEPYYADVRSTRYRRSFSLSGEQLDTQAVEASLKDGALRLRIPKRAEHKPRRIEVNAS